MNVKIVNMAGHSRPKLEINGTDIAPEVESFVIEGLMGHKTAITLVVLNANLDLEVDGDVLIAQSTTEIANYIRTLNPDSVQARALRKLGMDGNADGLVEAILQVVAEDLEVEDEAEPDADTEDLDLADDGRGLRDPLGGGFGG